MRSAALALLAAVAVGGFGQAAEARPRTSSLAWVRMPGAEGCIDARSLAQAVEQRLGRAAFVPPTVGDVAIEGRIERPQGTSVWQATIQVFNAGGAVVGARELQSAQIDCRAIDDELELVIALLIDPDAALVLPGSVTPRAGGLSATTGGLSAEAAEPVRLVQLPSRVTGSPLLDACPPPPPPPGPPLRVGGTVSAVGGLGLVPGPASVGLAVRAHLATPTPRGLGFELGGVLWASPVLSEAPGAPAFSLAYGTLAACPFAVAREGTALSACVGAMLGSLRVEGSALASKFRQEQLVFDVSLEARARQRLAGPLFGAIGLGIAVPMVRDIYYFIDADRVRHDVFQASPVAAILDIGLGLELP